MEGGVGGGRRDGVGRIVYVVSKKGSREDLDCIAIGVTNRVTNRVTNGTKDRVKGRMKVRMINGIASRMKNGIKDRTKDRSGGG
jgi:hypothetical protein